MKKKKGGKYGLLCAAVLAVVLVITLSQTVQAETPLLWGCVIDRDNAAVSGVEISAVDPATGQSCGVDTSDAEGLYFVDVTAGTYNMIVTPPAASGFRSTTVEGITVTGDTLHNIVLVPLE